MASKQIKTTAFFFSSAFHHTPDRPELISRQKPTMMMKRWSMGQVEVDQGKQQRSQSGWQDTHSADQYQSYVRQLLKSPSVAEPPPAAPAPAPAPPTTTTTTTTTTRQVDWSNRTSDDYHAHVNRMLRSPSIVDAPPYPKVHTLFNNDHGRLN